MSRDAVNTRPSGNKRVGIFLSAVLTILAFSAQAQAPCLYANDGTFLGCYSNEYDPNSVNNPYGRYGSEYSPDSIQNPYGKYGSEYSPESPNNPYAVSPIMPLEPIE